MRSTPPVWGSQAIRLGVLVNPFSRHNQATRWYQDPVFQRQGIAIRATASLEEVPDALDELLQKHAITVLGICGGDGTIHHAINALLARWPWDTQSDGPARPCPPLLLLRGGTLNLLARTFRIEGEPKTLLLRLASIWKGLSFEALPLRSLRLLRLDTPTLGHRYGYIFGSALTAWALRLYEDDLGGGYLGLARFLREAILGYLLKTPLWQASRHQFEAPPLDVWIDQEYRACRAIVASTVDISLLAGLIQGLIVEAETPKTMQIRLLDPSPVSVLIRQIPRLVFGLRGQGIVDRPEVHSLRLSGSFSFDGEIYNLPSDSPLSLSSPPWSLSVISPLP